MNTDEFCRLVASEPERVVTQRVGRLSPEAFLGAGPPRAISLVAFMEASRRDQQEESVLYRHILGEPASEAEVDAWERLWPPTRLPADLRALLLRINGIHLWADSRTGRAYFGIAPIEEWGGARAKVYGFDADTWLLEDKFIAISYHDDNAAFVALDGESGDYFLMDTAGPDTTSRIARSADELLDYVWDSRIPP